MKNIIIASLIIISLFLVLPIFNVDTFIVFNLIEWATKFLLPWVFLNWLIRLVKGMQQKKIAISYQSNRQASERKQNGGEMKMKQLGQSENLKKKLKKRELFFIALVTILILKLNVELIIDEKILTGSTEQFFWISISIALAIFFIFEKRYGYFSVFLIILILSIIK